MNKLIYFTAVSSFLTVYYLIGFNNNDKISHPDIHMEAEYADTIGLPFEIGEDENASGSRFLIIKKGQMEIHGKAGIAAFNFVTEKAVRLNIWIRVKSENPCINSFYLSVDGNRRLISGQGTSSDEWVWVYNSSLPVSKGPHKLEIMAREDLCLLDKIILTSQSDFPSI
jgi:hypothetical protein